MKNKIKLKLKLNKVGLLYIKGKIKGKPTRLILDTGATTSVIDAETAKRLALASKKSKRVAGGLGTATHSISKIKPFKIELGGIKFPKQGFIMLDLGAVNESLIRENTKPIQGIIGSDFLMAYKARINYEKQEVSLTL